MKKVSFVIPCYRSEKTLEGVVSEIKETMQKLQKYSFEIILVNDSSPDNTWQTIQKVCRENDNVVGVNAVLEIARANGVTGIKHPPLFGTTEAEHYTRELISFINNYLKIDVLGDRAYHGKKISGLSNRGEAHSANSDFTNATAGMMYDKEFNSPEEMITKFTSCPPKHFQKFSDTLNSIE